MYINMNEAHTLLHQHTDLGDNKNKSCQWDIQSLSQTRRFNTTGVTRRPPTADHSEAPLFTSGFCCSIIVCPLHLFLLVSALSVFLWFTASNHPFGLLFLIWCLNTCNWWIFLVDFFLVAFVYTNTLNWNWRALLWVFAWLIDWCQNM